MRSETRAPRRWITALLAAASVALAAGCLHALLREEGPAYWAFSHKLHIESDLGCADCHGDVAAVGIPKVPGQADCLACHPLDEDAVQPFEAELKASPTLTWRRVSHREDLRFDHKAHLAKKIECAACHGDMAASTRVTAKNAPGYGTCRDCHAEREVASACADCHTESRMEVAPGSHDAGWGRTHGRAARYGLYARHGGEADCTLCHAEEQCTGCHADNAPEDHSHSWRFGAHGIAAGMERERCTACHQEDVCVRCHEETTPRSHRGTAWRTPLNYHCVNCHTNPSAIGCQACHRTIPSHASVPTWPAGHVSSLPCRTCHSAGNNLTHYDNGQACTDCHQ